MNRAQRRAQKRERRDLVEAVNKGGKVPVWVRDDRALTGWAVLALVRREDVKHYESAPNAKVKGGDQDKVIVLQHFSDDSSMIVHRGNPRRYSHANETSDNPARVWTMRKLGSNDPETEAFVRKIYRASVLDNLKAA